jgi:hypothetical protein
MVFMEDSYRKIKDNFILYMGEEIINKIGKENPKKFLNLYK